MLVDIRDKMFGKIDFHELYALLKTGDRNKCGIKTTLSILMDVLCIGKSID